MIVIDMDMPKNCEYCKALCSKNTESETVFYCGLNDKPITNCADFLNAISKNCPIKCDIKDIKAEIEHWEAEPEAINTDPYQIGAIDMKKYVLRVIDKHTKGDMENEV